MLTDLKIKNYALIKNQDICFRGGFNAVTGETGAGKSIILGALGLILGNRADTGVLLDAGAKCIIEGRFLIKKYKLEKWFSRHDLDWEPETLLRREVSSTGKSRAFINDTPVNLNVLKELGEKLIDIHSQHQTLKLTGASFQTSLLDAFAQHKDLLAAYREQYQQYSKLCRRLADLKEQEFQSQKDFDYFSYQLNELTAANLLPREDVALEEEQNLLNNAELIRQRLQEAAHVLYEGEHSVTSLLADLRKQVSAIAAYNATLAQLSERINTLFIEAKDIAGEAAAFSESISVDNKRLEEANARLQLIHSLLHKHRKGKVEDLLALADELAARVGSAENISSEIAALETELQGLKAVLVEQAGHISTNRCSQKKALEENLETLLREVGIPQAQIHIQLTRLPDLTENGMDAIDIRFSANKGSRPEPVSQVASGGELSRLMLCFKYILADTIFLPTIIFDEIDAGVSGEIAIKVGRIIKKLSGSHQVLCITHQPQVAAMGDHHYIVYKTSGDNFTETSIRQLAPAERVAAIATMIAGQNPSAVAIENARELLAFQ